MRGSYSDKGISEPLNKENVDERCTNPLIGEIIELRK